MNKTANFQLTQWEKTDRIMMEDFNRDNAAIDAALKSNADKAAALQTALAGAGNCSIETKSYTGDHLWHRLYRSADGQRGKFCLSLLEHGQCKTLL